MEVVTQSRPPSGFLSLIAIVGVAIFSWGLIEAVDNLKTAFWPTTSGVILDSHLEHNRDVSGIDSGFATIYYSPKVRFRYQVNGQTYVSERIWLHSDIDFSYLPFASEVIKTYPAGKKVEVAYDQDNPSRAVLRPGEIGGAWLPLLVGGLFAGVAGFSLLAARRTQNDRGSPRLLPGQRPQDSPKRRSKVWLRTSFGLVFLLVLSAAVIFWYLKPEKPTRQAPQVAKVPRTSAPASKPQAASHSVSSRNFAGKMEVQALLDKVAREPSPCPKLLASLDTRIAQGDLNDLLRQLFLCQWRRNTYIEAKDTLVFWRYHQLAPWPEEQGIDRVVEALAKQARPPKEANIEMVPLEAPPLIDGRIKEREWADAKVLSPKGTRTRIFVKTDGDFLYLAADVPENDVQHDYDSMRVIFHAHLSPHLRYEYFFVYGGRSGYSSMGARRTNVKLPDAPKDDGSLPARQRWKAYPVTDDNVFPAPRSASLFNGVRRMYEVAIDLKQTNLPVGHPFSLGMVLEIAPLTEFGPKTKKMRHIRRRYVWPFQPDYQNGTSLWETWLLIPNPPSSSQTQ